MSWSVLDQGRTRASWGTVLAAIPTLRRRTDRRSMRMRSIVLRRIPACLAPSSMPSTGIPCRYRGPDAVGEKLVLADEDVDVGGRYC